MHYLEPVAQRFGLTVADLRRVAFERCGIPKDAPEWAVDCWLSQTVSIASEKPVSDFAADETGLLKAIEWKLGFKFAHGSFVEKCVASWRYSNVAPFLDH